MRSNNGSKLWRKTEKWIEWQYVEFKTFEIPSKNIIGLDNKIQRIWCFIAIIGFNNCRFFSILHYFCRNLSSKHGIRRQLPFRNFPIWFIRRISGEKCFLSTSHFHKRMRRLVSRCLFVPSQTSGSFLIGSIVLNCHSFAWSHVVGCWIRKTLKMVL